MAAVFDYMPPTPTSGSSNCGTPRKSSKLTPKPSKAAVTHTLSTPVTRHERTASQGSKCGDMPIVAVVAQSIVEGEEDVHSAARRARSDAVSPSLLSRMCKVDIAGASNGAKVESCTRDSVSGSAHAQAEDGRAVFEFERQDSSGSTDSSLASAYSESVTAEYTPASTTSSDVDAVAAFSAATTDSEVIGYVHAHNALGLRHKLVCTADREALYLVVHGRRHGGIKHVIELVRLRQIRRYICYILLHVLMFVHVVCM